MLNLSNSHPKIVRSIHDAFLTHGQDCDEYGYFDESNIREIESQSHNGFIPFTNGGLDAMVMRLLGNDESYMGINEAKIIRPFYESATRDAALCFIESRDELACLVKNADHTNADTVLFDYFDTCETEHGAKSSQYPVDLLGDKIPAFWSTAVGMLREDFYAYESEYLSEGGDYWIQFRAVFFAADNRRNITGKDEIFFYSGINTDFTYGRDEGLECTFERTYPIERLTPNRIEVIVAAMRDNL